MMSEADAADPYAALERITVITDGGAVTHGQTLGACMTLEQREALWAYVLANRVL